MKATAIITFLLALFSTATMAQSTTEEPVVVHNVVVGGDTMPNVSLREVEIKNGRENVVFRSDFDRLKYYVKKVYPYAKITSEIINEYDSAYAQLDRRREKRKFMKQVERDLKEEFSDELKNLTVSQGRILIKLINRETGVTSYDLIKEFKGGFSAFFWQGVAKLFGSDLKDDFDVKEDAMIDYIVRKIERGEIYVPERKRKTEISLEKIES